MREIVLDTETTGLDPQDGHRLVEIGAVELFNHVPTGRTYHQYINPQRAMTDGAFAVHGISDVFLADKPVFADIVAAFLTFLDDAVMVIHNAAFDMKFLNAELGWAGHPALPMSRAIDTLDIARRRFPGSPVSLDALCRRFAVDNAARTKHGALLDSEILAEVYLELVGGRQPGLALGAVAKANADGTETGHWRPAPRSRPLPPRLTEAEAEAHAAFVAELGAAALWSEDAAR